MAPICICLGDDFHITVLASPQLNIKILCKHINF